MVKRSRRPQRTPEQALGPSGALLLETWRAWNDRELSHLASLFSEDVVYDVTEIGDAVIIGRERLRAYFDEVISLSDVVFDVELIRESGDRVVSVIAVRGRGEQSGAPIMGRLAQVATVRDGLITHARNYADPADAHAAIDHPPGDP